MTRWKVCSVVDCPQIHCSSSGRCPEHQRIKNQEYEAERPSSTERGYGSRHRRNGAIAIANSTHCQRCGEPFTDANPVTRGHVVPVRLGGTSEISNYMAECRLCNYGRRGSEPASWSSP